MGSPTIDYDALAAQHGGTAAPADQQQVDYDKLAAEHGGTAIDRAVQGLPPEPDVWEKAQHMAKEFFAPLNPVTAVQGLSQLAAHPVDTLKADNDLRMQIYNKVAEKYGKGEYANGLAHGIYAGIPLLGPQLDRLATMGEQGDVGGMVAGSLGTGVSLAAPELLKGTTVTTPTAGMQGPGVSVNIPGPQVNLHVPGASAVARDMYQRILKPSGTAEQAAQTARTGLEAGIPISEGGQAKLGGLIDDLNAKIKAQIDVGSAKGATVDPQAVASRTDQLKSGPMGKQVTPENDLATVDSVRDEFLRRNPNPIPAADAQEMKQATGVMLRKKYGELGSARVEAEKALTRGIKEELEVPFPEIKGMNAQDAKFYQLDEALDTAVRRYANHNAVNLKDIAAATTGAAAGLAHGGGLEAVGAGGAAALMSHVLQDPAVQSRLLIVLNKMGKGVALTAARARILGYANALGNAANAPQPSDRSSAPDFSPGLVQYR